MCHYLADGASEQNIWPLENPPIQVERLYESFERLSLLAHSEGELIVVHLLISKILLFLIGFRSFVRSE
jgi:hypothetical protein